MGSSMSPLSIMMVIIPNSGTLDQQILPIIAPTVYMFLPVAVHSSPPLVVDVWSVPAHLSQINDWLVGIFIIMIMSHLLSCDLYLLTSLNCFFPKLWFYI